MTYRVLHSSDHHLEGVYPDFKEEWASKLREASWKALERCAEYARTEAADAWVICGDLLEDAHADITVIDRLFELIRGVMPTQVVLVPGPSDAGTNTPYYSLPTGPENLVVAGLSGWEAINLGGLALLCRGGTVPASGGRPLPRPRGKGPHPAIAFITGSVQKDNERFGEGAMIVPSEVRATGIHAVAAGSHHGHMVVGDAPPVVYCGAPTVMDWRDAGRKPGFCFWEIPEGAPPGYEFVELPGIRVETVEITAPDIATARSLIKPLKTGADLWVKARVRFTGLVLPDDLENFCRNEERREGLTVEATQEAPKLEVGSEEPTLRAFYQRFARDDYARDGDAEESAIWTDSVIAGLQALEETRLHPPPPARADPR